MVVHWAKFNKISALERP